MFSINFVFILTLLTVALYRESIFYHGHQLLSPLAVFEGISLFLFHFLHCCMCILLSDHLAAGSPHLAVPATPIEKPWVQSLVIVECSNKTILDPFPKLFFFSSFFDLVFNCCGANLVKSQTTCVSKYENARELKYTCKMCCYI